MKRQLHRLSAKEVSNLKAPGYHADGAGLYLQVSATGTKSWIFRYERAGKVRDMGLGPLHTVTLSGARDKASENRRLLLNGVDPLEARNQDKARIALVDAKTMLFKDCAEKYIRSHRAGWKNAKHAAQWESTIATYCDPIIGHVAAQDVDTGLIMKVLDPIWSRKSETASRVRSRMESILDWAAVRGLRTGENPARWRGHLDKLLPALRKKRRVKHHPALPFEQIGDFMPKLRAQDGISARALEFLILTTMRTTEVRLAEPDEINFSAAVWTIPKIRMKADLEHRVPLCRRALAIARAQIKTGDGKFLFGGKKLHFPLSDMAMLELLRGMGYGHVTVHGFRSTFRDWAAERTNFSNEVCEMALAHSIGDETEAAYRRGDLFNKRRKLMAEWEKFCDTRSRSGKVIPLFASRRKTSKK